tara:strand:+ start:58 stop:1137 length:1080 start_codon:yes stop_codon:yes gene_type:complete
MFKYSKLKIRESIFYILIIIFLFLISISDSRAKGNIFVVKGIKVNGTYNVNFSREKFINKALEKSFKKLISNILLQEDRNKLENLSLDEIKTLVFSFKILEEKFDNNKYYSTLDIQYSDSKIKKLLSDKNISYYDPKNTTLIFFPILFINNELKIFEDNYFYRNWETDLDEKTIKYVLPIEELDDILYINKTKDEIETLDFSRLAAKYDISNYAVLIMNYKPDKLKIYLKTNLDAKKYNKNIVYDLKSLNDKAKLNSIISDLKLRILDMWKRANLINIPLPLNILVKFKHKDLVDLNNLEKTLNKIHIINKHSLEKFDFQNSYYRINYSGDPKKLSEDFLNFDYLLRDNQGIWELVKND